MQPSLDSSTNLTYALQQALHVYSFGKNSIVEEPVRTRKHKIIQVLSNIMQNNLTWNTIALCSHRVIQNNASVE